MGQVVHEERGGTDGRCFGRCEKMATMNEDHHGSSFEYARDNDNNVGPG